MQFATFPPRLRLVKCSTETYYCFFFPSAFSSVTEFFLSSSCTVVYYVSGPFWLAADWDLPLESSGDGADPGSLEHCYFHHRVRVRPPIWSRIKISLRGVRRKKLHASNVVEVSFLDSPMWKWKTVKSHILSMENVYCYVCHQEKWPPTF